MMTEFSPFYTVIQTRAGFAIVNSLGGHEALFSNRGEAEEIAAMMNEQVTFSIDLQNRRLHDETSSI